MSKLKCMDCGNKFNPKESPSYPEKGPDDSLTCPNCGSESWEPWDFPEPTTEQVEYYRNWREG